MILGNLHKQFYVLSILTFFLLILIPSNSIYAQSENSIQGCQAIDSQESTDDAKKYDTKLKSSVEKIILTKFISIDSSHNEKSISSSFTIINVGCQTATEVKAVLGELFIKDRDKISTAPDYFSQEDFIVQINNGTLIAPNEYSTITITPSKDSLVTIKSTTSFNQTGTYVGKLYIFGNNIETQSVDVEITVKQKPLELVYAAIFGTAIAITFGSFFAINEREREYLSKYDKVSIKHINHHIENLNCVKNTFKQTVWVHISCIHNQKKKYIEEKMKSAKPLDLGDDAIKWYEEQVVELVKTKMKDEDVKTVDVSELIKKVFELVKTKMEEESSDPKDDNVDLILIKTPDEFKLKFEDIIKKQVRKEVKISKIIFAIISGLVAIPVTLFSENYFMGDPFADILIAIGIGFMIYRTQDISKVVTKWRNIVFTQSQK